MKIAIIGAGAVGAMVAYQLHQAGVGVVLVAKKHQAEKINAEGLCVTENGQSQTFFIPCQDHLDHQPDLVIFAMKTQDVTYAYRDYAEQLPLDSHVLMLQNGVQAENMLSTHIHPEHIYSGIVLFWTDMVSPRELVIHQPGGIMLGRAFYANNPKMREIVDVMTQATEVNVVDEIMNAKWLKLLVNMCNVPSALVNQSLQEAYQHDEVCALNYRMIREALEIFEKAGIELADFAYIKVDRFLEPYRQTEAEAIPTIKKRLIKLDPSLLGSMLQSLRAQKPSEIDYINGEIVQLAKGVESQAPVNAAIIDAIHQIERSGTFYELPQIASFMK